MNEPEVVYAAQHSVHRTAGGLRQKSESWRTGLCRWAATNYQPQEKQVQSFADFQGKAISNAKPNQLAKMSVQETAPGAFSY